MTNRLFNVYRRSIALTTTAAAAILAAGLINSVPAQAASPPVRHPRILVHLNLAALQQPENLTLEPDGSADLTFAFVAQVARVTRQGQVSRIAQLPVPANGHVPLTNGKKAVLAGIVRAGDGTLYVNLSTGTAKDTGVWRIRPGAAPARIAALPPSSFANGLALDQAAGQLYVADSANQVIWRIPLRTGVATVWAGDPRCAACRVSRRPASTASRCATAPCGRPIPPGARCCASPSPAIRQQAASR